LQFARRSSMPVVGNSDTHFLWQLGRTYTEIDAPPDCGAIIEAVRHGRVRLVTQPLSWVDVVRFVVRSHSTSGLLRDGLEYMVKVLRRTKRAALPAPPSSVRSSLPS
jgi:PHP domain-containing protein